MTPRKTFYNEVLSESSGNGLEGARITEPTLDVTKEDYWMFSSVQIQNDTATQFSNIYLEQVSVPDEFPLVTIPQSNNYKTQQATTDYHTFPQIADIESELDEFETNLDIYQWIFRTVS